MVEAKIDSTERCSSCGGDIITVKDEQVCDNCGLVVEQPYHPCRSMTRFGAEDHYVGKRVHIINGLGSEIGYIHQRIFTDRNGVELPAQKILKLKAQQQWIRTSGNGINYQAFLLLNRVVDRLALSKLVRDRAAYYLTKLGDLHVIKLSKTRSNSPLTVAICLLIATREFKENAPVTIQTLAKAFNSRMVTARRITRCLNIVENRLKIKTPIRQSEDYLPKIISDALRRTELENKDEYGAILLRKSTSILQEIQRYKGGRNPFILAVTSIYAADVEASLEMNLDRVFSQKTLGQATNVPEYGIRTTFRFLKKTLSRFQWQRKRITE